MVSPLQSGSKLGFADVVLVPFPFTDLSTRKKRPAVVVSSQSDQSKRPDIVIMAITSQVRTPLGFGEAMVIDWRKARLIKESVLEPIFATLEQGLVLKVLGRLSTADRITLRNLVEKVIG